MRVAAPTRRARAAAGRGDQPSMRGETTARHALCLGFFPVVLADACAAWTETQHVRLLAAMADGVGGATTLEELWP